MKKKIMLIMLSAVMVITMSACGESEEEIDTTTEQGGPVNRGEMMDEAQKNIPENMESGYEIVDSIDIDSGDTRLRYVKSERHIMNNGGELFLVYFEFTNISAGETGVDAQYNFRAYQDGVEITVYSSLNDELEEDTNRRKHLLSGASLEIVVGIEPENWDSAIKLRVDDEMLYDETGTQHTFQQQEIQIAE